MEQPTLPSPEEAPPARELSPEEQLRRQRLITAGIIAGVVVILALVVTVIVLLASNPPAATMTRDIAIIILAVESIFVGLMLLVLTYQLQALIRMLRDEIKPMLESANQTMATVRGTTQFVGENVVRPVIKASSFLAGLRRIVREIGGLRRREE